MKKNYSLILLCALGLSLLSASANAMRQPAMERSLQALQNAERILKRALPNKGGHRVKAIKHIQRAIREVRKGIDYANRRPAGGQYKQGREMRREMRKEMRDERREERRNKWQQQPEQKGMAPKQIQ